MSEQSEAAVTREVGEFVFTSEHDGEWTYRMLTGDVIRVTPLSAGWVVNADCFYLDPKDATRFAQAIGAAAKLADELNGRKE